MKRYQHLASDSDIFLTSFSSQTRISRPLPSKPPHIRAIHFRSVQSQITPPSIHNTLCRNYSSPRWTEYSCSTFHPSMFSIVNSSSFPINTQLGRRAEPWFLVRSMLLAIRYHEVPKGVRRHSNTTVFRHKWNDRDRFCCRYRPSDAFAFESSSR